MRTFSLLIFCFTFIISGLALVLAERLFRQRGQVYLRSYVLHLTFWNGHALVMFIQYILGVEFLPRESWAPLMHILGPVVALSAGLSLYFLMMFAAQLVGRAVSRFLSVVTFTLWACLVLVFVLAAGGSPGGPNRGFLGVYSLAFAALKIGTVLGSMGFVLLAAGRTAASGIGRAQRAVAWTYLAGFLLFQLAVSSPLSHQAGPLPDYLTVSIQISFQFPVLAMLGRYASRRAATLPADAFARPEDMPQRLREMGISPREAEIVGLILRGMSNTEIERELFISLETVKKHLTSIYRKLGVRNRLQLSLFFQKKAANGVSIEPDELVSRPS